MVQDIERAITEGGEKMEKKDIVIIALSAALLFTFIGFVSTSIKVGKITAEKGEFMEKIRETENLASELNKNMDDLRSILGRAEKEKEILAQKADEMKKRLQNTSDVKEAIPGQAR